MIGGINLLRSPTGRAFVAIRDSAVAAQSLGVHVAYHKTMAFGLSAVFGGLPGRCSRTSSAISRPTSSAPVFDPASRAHRRRWARLDGRCRLRCHLRRRAPQALALRATSCHPRSLSFLASRRASSVSSSCSASFTSPMASTGAGSRSEAGCAHRRCCGRHRAAQGLREVGAAGMRLLEVDNIAVNFGGIRAVDGISLGADAAEIVSVIGPNGAGKTTLFNLISRIFEPSTGRIAFDGREITGAPAPARRDGNRPHLSEPRTVRVEHGAREPLAWPAYPSPYISAGELALPAESAAGGGSGSRRSGARDRGTWPCADCPCADRESLLWRAQGRRARAGALRPAASADARRALLRPWCRGDGDDGALDQ